MRSATRSAASAGAQASAQASAQAAIASARMRRNGSKGFVKAVTAARLSSSENYRSRRRSGAGLSGERAELREVGALLREPRPGLARLLLRAHFLEHEREQDPVGELGPVGETAAL